MAMLESAIERKAVSALLRKHGIPSVKLTSQYGTGFPDRLFFLPNGRVLMIEFKRPGGKLTPKQAHVHEALRKAGHEVAVCYDAQDAVEAVEVAWERARCSVK